MLKIAMQEGLSEEECLNQLEQEEKMVVRAPSIYGRNQDKSSLIEDEEEEKEEERFKEIDIRQYAGDPKKEYLVRVE
jgi:hypothetical protein